jgi:hypothetical protein
MRRRSRLSDEPGFIDDIRDRQRNILWQDSLVNSRSVDVFLWRGSPNPTMVQRVGAWLFGATFIGAGACLVSLAWMEGTWSWGVVAIATFGLGSIAAGVKIFANGCRKHRPDRR